MRRCAPSRAQRRSFIFTAQLPCARPLFSPDSPRLFPLLLFAFEPAQLGNLESGHFAGRVQFETDQLRLERFVLVLGAESVEVPMLQIGGKSSVTLDRELVLLAGHRGRAI